MHLAGDIHDTRNVLRILLRSFLEFREVKDDVKGGGNQIHR